MMRKNNLYQIDIGLVIR